MAHITDLPPELLSLIVALYRNPPSSSGKPNDIRHLSLVNKAFDVICAPFLFRYHRVELRRRWKPFSPDYARERISVISHRASCIRELSIIDCVFGDDASGDVDDGDEENVNAVGAYANVFPDVIIPELLTALRLLTDLEKLGLVSPGEERRMPGPLWTWIRELDSPLKHLNLAGSWLPPTQGGVIKKVEKLTLNPLSEGNFAFIKLVKAPSIHVINDDIIAFKPGVDERHLRNINMVIKADVDAFLEEYMHKPTQQRGKGVLDFSGLPFATVVVEVRSTNEDPDISKFSEWKKVRKVVNTIFTQDLRFFNVKRWDREPVATIWRNSGIGRVKHQDQIVNEEADKIEREREREEEMRLMLEEETQLLDQDAREPRRIRFYDVIG